MSLNNLAATIADRVGGDPDTSWTAKLLADPDLAAKKFGEEAVEAVIEAVKNDPVGLRLEAADVLYHLLVMCAGRGVSLTDLEEELARRTGQGGISEKASR